MNLSFFLNKNIHKAGTQFFLKFLNINIAPATISGLDIKDFLKEYLTDEKLLSKVRDARLIGMINDLSLQDKAQKKSAEDILRIDNGDYDMILVFGIEIINGLIPTKSDISRLTRALNRRSASRPVVLLTRYSDKLTFSAAERGDYKRKGQKGEKVSRISILRDIDLNRENIHAGHERIILQLRINPLRVGTFKELYAQWLEVFNVNILNKEFYSELFTWYLWAIRTVSFPNRIDDDQDDTVFNSENVIRLLTRLIFIWFIKEKRLVPDSLFEKTKISEILKAFNPNADDNSDYYKAILQNLFFATLNTEMPIDGGKRAFIDGTKKNKKTGYTEEYMDHLVFRHKNLFIKPEEGLKLFENIPFLNGGLFECLDRRDSETNEEIRIDGFSSTPSKQPVVPNVLFFGRNDDLDLSNEFENSKKYKHCRARGIINILNSYKFTIEENTPLEQEIALDPELLGKIFENLLASYNPETRTTARKQTGSYYTPREIVNYMVDESLIAFLKTRLTVKSKTYQELGKQQTNFLGNEGKTGQLDMQIDLAAGKWEKNEEELECKLRKLFAYESEGNPFNDDEETTKAIIAHLSECKILDPACGSGAFPMGILHKMVFALGKLDPCNYTWKQAQLEKAQRDKQRAQKFEDDTLREVALKSAKEKIAYVEASFGETGHELDYARKLFLIEHCIYGVDIQQIAVQISKLRFFISLMVDQRVDDNKPNRNILSLPNLETKFVAANTLIPVEKPQQLTFKDPEVEKTEKELHEIHQKIFFTRNYSDKKKLKNEELRTRHSLRKLYIDKAGYTKEAAEKITQWNPFDPLQSAPFFDPEVMFTIEVYKQGGYFDVVIGNPPYIKEYTFKEAFNGVRDSKYYKGKMDIWYMFACVGLDMLFTNSGHLCFIATNNWVTNFGASILREKIVSDTKIIQLLDFNNYKIFESSEIQTMVMLFQNNSIADNYNLDYRKLTDRSINYTDVLQLLQKVNANYIIISPTFNRHLYKDRYILFAPKKQETVLNKIATKENLRLLENGDKKHNILPEIGQGIVAPQDSLNNSGYKKLSGNHNIGEGIFFITKDEYKNYQWNDKEVDLIRPLFNSKQIKKYWTISEYSNLVIYTDSRFKGSNLKKVRSPIKINDYPNIKKHLDPFVKIITSDNKPYGLHRSREERLFEGEKIFVLRKCSGSPIFSYCNFQSYVSQSYNIIKTNRVNYLFLIGLLNSKLIAFWLKYRGKMQGSNYQLDSEPLSQIPINIPNDITYFKLLVNNIIDNLKKNQNIDRDVANLDYMVYKLYSLTYEECKIIDPEIEKLISRKDYERMSIEELAEYEINN